MDWQEWPNEMIRNIYFQLISQNMIHCENYCVRYTICTHKFHEITSNDNVISFMSDKYTFKPV